MKKRSTLCFLLTSVLALAMCVALPSCKKKDAAAPAGDAAAPAADAAKADAAKADAAKADAAKADAAAPAADAAKADAAKADAAKADAAKADAAKADAAAPAAPVALKFAKWAKNPLFIDGNVIHLGYELALNSDDDSRKGAPGWKCEGDDCTLEVKSDLDCTVKIVLNEDKYSASILTCATKDGAYFPAETFPNGVWAIDSVGIHFSADTEPMKRRATPGCEDCKEGTLEYDFEDMDDREGWVVSFESAEAPSGDDEEHGCNDGCEVSGSKYTCCTSDLSGYQIVWDNDRGLVEYEGVAYGDVDGELGNLKIKAK